MTLNAVYKKDAESVDDSISPGITQDDINDQSSSLVDLFIQNSKPSVKSRASQRGPREALDAPHGPHIGNVNQSQQDEDTMRLYMAQSNEP